MASQHPDRDIIKSTALDIQELRQQAGKHVDALHDLKPFLSSIEAAMPAEHLFAYVVDGMSRELVLVRRGKEPVAFRVPLQAGNVYGHAVLNRKAVNIPDTTATGSPAPKDTRMAAVRKRDEALGIRTRAALILPVTHGDVIIGALELVNRKSGGPFTKTDAGNLRKACRAAAPLLACLEGQVARTDALPEGLSEWSELIRTGLIGIGDLQTVVTQARMDDKCPDPHLAGAFGISEDAIRQSLAHRYGLPAQPFTPDIPAPRGLLSGLTTKFLKAHRWVPLARSVNGVRVAFRHPEDSAIVSAARQLLPTPIEAVVSTEMDINRFIDRFYGHRSVGDSGIDRVLAALQADDDPAEKNRAGTAVATLVDKVFNEAAKRKATHIHVDARGKPRLLLVRLRIDGNYRPYLNIPASFAAGVISRIKIMAGLDIAERRLPQTGTIAQKAAPPRPALKVTTVPTRGGMESIVAELRPATAPPSFRRLFLSNDNCNRWQAAISAGQGIALVSGKRKTTIQALLRASLQAAATPDKQVWSLDAVERWPAPSGVGEVALNPRIGFDTARALKTLAGAAPDILLVGELRDRETAALSIDTAQDGCLVLAGLNAPDAAGAIDRLSDMGFGKPRLLHVLSAVLAASELRRLCADCRVSGKPSQRERDLIARVVARSSPDGAGPDTEEGSLWHPTGCPKCCGTGYRGSIQMHEVLVATTGLMKLSRETSDSAAFIRKAVACGMAPMSVDAVSKLFRGLVDITEVERIFLGPN